MGSRSLTEMCRNTAFQRAIWHQLSILNTQFLLNQGKKKPNMPLGIYPSNANAVYLGENKVIVPQHGEIGLSI